MGVCVVRPSNAAATVRRAPAPPNPPTMPPPPARRVAAIWRESIRSATSNAPAREASSEIDAPSPVPAMRTGAAGVPAPATPRRPRPPNHEAPPPPPPSLDAPPEPAASCRTNRAPTPTNSSLYDPPGPNRRMAPVSMDITTPHRARPDERSPVARTRAPPPALLHARGEAEPASCEPLQRRILRRHSPSTPPAAPKPGPAPEPNRPAMSGPNTPPTRSGRCPRTSPPIPCDLRTMFGTLPDQAPSIKT